MDEHEIYRAISEADAWAEYLAETRGLRPIRYRELEPWAWAKLQARLGNLKPRRVRSHATEVSI